MDTCNNNYQYQVINACTTGQLDVLESCANLYNVNDFLCKGWTPLLHASFSVQPDIIQYLLTNGADPNKHKDGYTPLMALCNSANAGLGRSLRCLKLLIEGNADPDATSMHRQTALMYSCKSQEPEFVTELIKHVKHINTMDTDNRSAIFYAVTANKIEIVKILLENNADITLVDCRGYTVKDIAIEKGHTEILQLLDPNEESIEECFEYETPTWKDMFPRLNINDKTKINPDVSTLLDAMGLDKYKHLFKGVSLKTFLTATDSTLSDLGVDISAHRKQFANCIYKFHQRKWHVKSVGVIDDTAPYTIFNGVMSLGMVAKQVAVMDCSFRYIQDNLLKAINGDNCPEVATLVEYDQELKTTQKNLKSLKIELLRMKTFANKIKKECCLGAPPTYIGPKKDKNWTTNLSIILLIGVSVPTIFYALKFTR